MARQVLSLVAGGAIDEWLLSNLRFMRQEHTLARVIHHLQNQLWPGGAWYQSLPEHRPQVSLMALQGSGLALLECLRLVNIPPAEPALAGAHMVPVPAQASAPQ